jgi:hypothetical protein
MPGWLSDLQQRQHSRYQKGERGVFGRSDRGGKTSKGEAPPPSLTGVSTLSATGQRWRAVWAREAEFETHHRPRDWENAPSRVKVSKKKAKD